MASKICRYTLSIPRSSDLEGVFVVTDAERRKLKKLEGREVYYGEVAGKHSDVTAEFSLADLEIVSAEPEHVKFFKELFPGGVGYDFKGIWLEQLEEFEQEGE